MKIFKKLLLFCLSLFVLSCSKEEIDIPQIDINSEIECNINTFTSNVNKTSSHYNPHFVPFTNYFEISGDVAVDYSCISTVGRVYLNINNNDIPDLVFTKVNGCNTEYGTVYVVIDGNLSYEFQSPQTVTNKLLRGDINKDGIDDVVMIGTGLDAPPYPGDKNFIIYFNESSYELVELDEEYGYFHTGVMGDVNNDGNLDILPIHPQYTDSYIHLGNSDGTFNKQKVFDREFTTNTFQAELFDFNNDGNLDIILGGAEWTSFDYDSPFTKILLGDGTGQFDIDSPINLPRYYGWGVITNFRMVDLDNDGVEEIIVTRTSGTYNNSQGGVKNEPAGFYDDFKIQILKREGNEYIQTQIINSPPEFVDLWIQWIQSTHVIDLDGDCILDLVPESGYINDYNYDSMKKFNKLYYKGTSDGKYKISYYR